MLIYGAGAINDMFSGVCFGNVGRFRVWTIVLRAMSS